ncbi:hypothetical protein [Virgibacillus dokdonensis]|uniref:hypothetical protein n=1 Tax=Virgibacillus dokdonensis TaxID=302167 RepID=UPI000989F302|nr:hypothetical protein [Virgibacillus dokdonensis]
MLENGIVDWNAITAISNISLSVLTLLALAVTLYTVRVSNFPKGELLFRKEKRLYQIRFVNKRNVPIIITEIGFYIKMKKDKKINVLSRDTKRVKLEWADTKGFTKSKREIDLKLFKAGYSTGEKVIIVLFAKTTTNKLYTKKVRHIVGNTDIELSLNKATEVTGIDN